MLDMFQLRCFCAVAEELHFGRAAARMHMTQPPLSRQVQLLEHAVGVQLLARTSRRVALTAAGRVLYEDAARLLRLAGEAASAARRTGHGEAGRVVVGYTAVTGYRLIPQLLAAAGRAWPQIEIVLEEMVSSAQLRALEAGEIDLAVVRPLPAATDVQFAPATREPMVLAVPAGHRLAGKVRVKRADLAGEPLVMYSLKEGKYFHDRIAALFPAPGPQPRFVHHIGQTHTIMALVRAGIGLAIVPASAQELGFGNIVCKPLWRADAVAEVWLAWREDPRNPAQATIRGFFLQQIAVMGGAAAAGAAAAAQLRRAPAGR
jgi:DNA-binding transcriptional LysR family regulator